MTWQTRAALAALLVVTSVPSAMAAQGQARGVQLAGLFGESDEEKAARLQREQHEADQDAAIAELRQRVQDFEHALQQTTGQNEQLAHQIRQLNDRLDKQQKDFDYKLCTLAAQQLGAGTAPDQSGGGLPCDPNAAVASLTAPGGTSPAAGTAPPPAAKPDTGGSLGTLPANAAQANTSPSRAQFDEAMNLLARARYDEARAAFRAFADANPKDSLAPKALYWVGNIAYVQKDYMAAAQTFNEQIKKYPNSPQGAEAMLKLGLSLIALGEKKEGCLTLGAIKTKYKQAPASILTQAATARAASCPKER